MKVVYNSRTKPADISAITEKFPELDFVVTYGPDDVARELGDAEIMFISNRVYVEDMVAAVNANAGALRLIHFTTSGIDKALKSGGFPEGVTVANVAGLRGPTLGEHAFALLLCLSHRFRAIEAARKDHAWLRDEITKTVAPLKGQTLVIIGLGATGQSMARKARAFDMRVIGVSRAYEADDLVEEVFPRERVMEALAQADAVLMSMPSTAETRGFLDAEKFAAMKPNTLVINVARGDLINEADLIEACRSGTIGGAGLDVQAEEPMAADNPLWEVDNIVISPHVGGGGGGPKDTALDDMLIENLRLYCAGEPLKRLVDWPNMTV
ncbi:MAG: D-2-hydroxyacid dehydrogenase [Alphaproteobacteria bacterium]|nr:MAG: D-2-hydroxyacid dehydrogenase [Alphaproteobacteria bacterium]